MSHAVTDYSSALAFIYGRINYERTVPYKTSFRLERFQQFLDSLGNPEQRLPAVHITGTKGKGSTAHLAASILSAAGVRTALYTSPHLERLEERFVINGQPIATDEFVALAARLQPLVEESDREAEARGDRLLTFFEVTTALAFLAFVEAKVEIAVLEVGLGGRLDSTNVCRPLVCGITSISLDHTKQLGHTLAAIAREKAGIVKPGVPVVSGVLEAEPPEVIRQAAEAAEAKLWQRGEDFDFDYSPAASFEAKGDAAVQPGSIDYREPASGTNWKDLKLAMIGPHQGANAATAVALVRRLTEQGWPIGEEHIREGLRNGKCPARVEWLPGTPPVILDTAHNAASIKALLACLPPRASETSMPRLHRPRTLVFGASRDKDVREMLELLVPEFDLIVLTRYVNNPRAIEPAEMLPLVEEIQYPLDMERRARVVPFDSPADAFAFALTCGPFAAELVVITGSFFLAAELGPLARQPRERITNAEPLTADRMFGGSGLPLKSAN